MSVTPRLANKNRGPLASAASSFPTDKRTVAFLVASPTKINLSVAQKTENLISNRNGTSSAMMGSEDVAGSTMRDTIVVMITLTIIFFTLIATYFLWRKHRSTLSASHSVYMYSRLSQNDVEVDNISFQGDLTHKALINAVSVCAEDDSCDDDQVIKQKVRPATLRLEHDALVTISNDENRGHENQRKTVSSHQNRSATMNDAPVNLLIDEMSDEDLLQ